MFCAPTRSPLFLCSFVAGALALAACSDSGGRNDGEGDNGLDNSTLDGDADGTADGSGSADENDDGGELVDLRIEPMSPVILVEDGVVPAPTSFTIVGTNEAGDDVALGTATWTFDRDDLAGVTQGGFLQATGDLGGVGTLTAQANGLEATTDVTIKLSYVIPPEGGLDPSIESGFPGATLPDPSLALVYPYNETVFPRGLAGPVVQWNGGNVGDWYKLHIESNVFELTTYALAEPPSRWNFPLFQGTEDLWTLLTMSTAGEVAISVQRYDAATATHYTPVSSTWRIAEATLTGIVYYWSVSQGVVARIPVGATTNEVFMQPPVPVDVGDGNPNNQCIGCHSVSADGSTIVASTYGSASPWATWAADGSLLYQPGNTTGTYYPSDASGFQAVSPDGAFVLTGQSQQLETMKLSTSTSMDTLATLSLPLGTPGSPVHPTWSPDGTKVAFGLRQDGNWLDFTQAELWLTGVDLTTTPPTIATPTLLVDNVDVDRTTVTYPTFAPDSTWVAYNKANRARARPVVIDQNTGAIDGEGFGELWMVHAGTGAQVKLDEANGVGIIPVDQTLSNFEPTFMPVSVGGYYWLVFVSERPYGNTLTDTALMTRRKQLWVTAVDASVDGTGDPSHPAFWLPGQTLEDNNMRGYWALNPCAEDGEGCSAGFDCCSGFCNDEGICGPPEGECSPVGSLCEVDEDCCPGAFCIGGFCSIPAP